MLGQKEILVFPNENMFKLNDTPIEAGKRTKDDGKPVEKDKYQRRYCICDEYGEPTYAFSQINSTRGDIPNP